MALMHRTSLCVGESMGSLAGTAVVHGAVRHMVGPGRLLWTNTFANSAWPCVARNGKGSRGCLDCKQTNSSPYLLPMKHAVPACNRDKLENMKMARPTFRAAINKGQLGSNSPGTWGHAHLRGPCRGLL